MGSDVSALVCHVTEEKGNPTSAGTFGPLRAVLGGQWPDSGPSSPGGVGASPRTPGGAQLLVQTVPHLWGEVGSFKPGLRSV